jgi:sec-independent protein translocase protein TatC
VSFAYFLVMPAALKFAQLYGAWMNVDVPFWMAPDYASFLIKFMFGMGAGFELPVVLLALVKVGILDYAKLSAMRRYMIVGNLVLGALLTTPEVFTQVCMAIALQLLFEISVWIAWYWEWKEKKKAAP